jgi:soluble lytic murein transglycosylase-like protein
MNNRFKMSAMDSAHKLSLQFHTMSNAFAIATQDIRAHAQQALMMLGLAAIAALVLMFFKPELTDELKGLSPFSADYDYESDTHAVAFADMLELPAPESTNAALKSGSTFLTRPSDFLQSFASESLPSVTGKEEQRVSSWLARRYRIANSASKMLVEAAYTSSHEVRIDPLLILAVMAIESRLNPFAESAVGAQGLMQVMAKVHHDKFQDHGGVKAALNPVANIKVGALILKDYVRRGGSVEAGLKLYVGAGNMEGDGGYGNKVLAEYQRLQDVAAGKRVPTFTTPVSEAIHEAKAERKAHSVKDPSEEPA